MASPHIEIRPTQPEDCEAIAQLTNHFIRNTSTHFGYEELEASYYQKAMQDEPRFPWFSAFCEGTWAGYAKASTWRSRSAYRYTAETGIYLVEAFQKRGIAQALYQELLTELKKRNFRSAIAGISLPNPASIAFHEKMGFASIGTFKEVGYKFDAWHNVGFWQLDLSQI